ncbi:MAG: hypothetical protein HKM91_04515 [Altererythrobacter sp.]|nr:hypothetical protein [Altererythrobacter sp.]NNE50377.1 hypothetical protein [Altererythrobacter sp.]NNF93842.1 hypothetical protein [Altererythrobacter sp.]
MKTYLALSAALVVAACSPAAETEAEAPVEEVVAYDGSVAPGDYSVDDGESTSPFSIDADGNWNGVDDEGNPNEGTSEVVDGKICFTTAGDDVARCWLNEAPGEDGSFTSTSDEGETVTVAPVTAEAEG